MLGDKTKESLNLILQALRELHSAMKIQQDMNKEFMSHVNKMEDQYATMFQYILGKLNEKK